MAKLLLCSLGLILGSAATAAIDHGQGEMAGRVTETSVILQSRLTQGRTLINGDLPGIQGIARFEIADNPEFKKTHKTRWMNSSSDNDYIIKVIMNGLYQM